MATAEAPLHGPQDRFPGLPGNDAPSNLAKILLPRTYKFGDPTYKPQAAEEFHEAIQYHERQARVEAWRNAPVRLDPYEAGTRFDPVHNHTYSYPEGNILEIFHNGEWQQVMATAEAPYNQVEMQMLFNAYRTHQMSLGKPFQRPEMIHLGHGMGGSMLEAFKQAGSTGGLVVYDIELNKKVFEQAQTQISNMLNQLRTALPGVDIDVILINDDAYRFLEIMASAIKNGIKTIPDNMFDSRLPDGTFDKRVKRYSTKKKNTPTNGRTYTEKELPIVASPKNLFESDVFPINTDPDGEGEDTEGADNLNRAQDIYTVMDVDGCGTFFPYYPGYRGSIQGRQQSLLDENHLNYQPNGYPAILFPPDKYRYLTDPRGNPVRMINPILFWKRKHFLRTYNNLTFQ